MKMNKKSWVFVIASLTFFLMATHSASAAPEPPKFMVFSGYEVGSSTYSQIQAVGNAINAKYGTAVRALPFGDAVGRLLACKLGKSQFAVSAVDWYLAFEGLFDFSDLSWGPQPLELVWQTQPTSLVTLAATKKSGIKTPYDAKGKRIAQIVGSPSLNLSLTAWLAFGNLTWKDVEVVKFSGYYPSLSGLIDGSVDATFGFGTTPKYNDVAASPNGLVWVELPFSDTAGWQRLWKVAPHLQKFTATSVESAVGVTPDHPVQGATIVSPVTVSYAGAVPDDLAYFYVKAIDDLYPDYKDSFKVLKYWKVKECLVPQGWAPYHPGVVKYLKEKGIWNADFQKFQDGMLKRRQILQDTWDKTLAEGVQKGLKSKEIQENWLKNREEALDAQQPTHPSSWWQP